jgi:hypothetical protein
MHVIRPWRARCDGGARRCAAAGHRRLTGDGRSSAPELGLRHGLVLREEEDEANQTRALGGGLGSGVGTTASEASGARPVSGAWATSSRRREKIVRGRFLITRRSYGRRNGRWRWSGGGDRGGGAPAAVSFGWLGPAGEGGARARESSGGRRTRRAKERRSRGTFTGGRELPQPAMARCRLLQVVARTGQGEVAGGTGECKGGSCRGSRSVL